MRVLLGMPMDEWPSGPPLRGRVVSVSAWQTLSGTTGQWRNASLSTAVRYFISLRSEQLVLRLVPRRSRNSVWSGATTVGLCESSKRQKQRVAAVSRPAGRTATSWSWITLRSLVKWARAWRNVCFWKVSCRALRS
ncbi:hypothetical protein I7I50_06418 [Histoplasma capsulatum G186AR]|uniref:Uncharacterized protein n=1 Tax=Ajellomyces capsulatus TaxID=5037 RepID=A0A8H8D350_AJECA|nr:hypothetical protein I7I52_10507 [Histoplasma capsulatum]QSS67368.1 hypothetical protein I7I50_06418 [Histoplasma capsulatum G186AR]